MSNEELTIIWKTGTQKAKNKALKEILNKNHGLIYAAGKSMKLPNYHQNHETDFFQTACIYVMQALDTFDNTLGFRFSTHLAFRLKAAVNHYYKQFPTIRGRYRGGRYNQQHEIPEVVSLNSKLPESDKEYIEFLQAPKETETAEFYLKTMVSVLTPKEKKIIGDYYSEYHPSLKDVGDKLNVSREAVRQTKAKAINKMRRCLSRRGVFREIRELYLANQ